MAVNKTSLEHPTRSELDDLVQEFQNLAMDRSSPLRYLAQSIEGYERLKGSQTPSVLEAHMPVVSLLRDLSRVIDDPVSDIPDKYKILIKIFEEKCYQPAPADRRLKEGGLKQWPYVRGDDLVDAFIISAGFLDFLDRCFDRSGTIDLILFHLIEWPIHSLVTHLFLIQPLTPKRNRNPYLR